MKSIWIAAGFALMTATAASAGDNKSAEQTAVSESAGETAASETAEQETVQCRYERVTGSRTKAYRICLTKADWNKRMVAEREELEKLRSNTQTGAGGAGGGS